MVSPLDLQRYWQQLQQPGNQRYDCVRDYIRLYCAIGSDEDIQLRAEDLGALFKPLPGDELSFLAHLLLAGENALLVFFKDLLYCAQQKVVLPKSLMQDFDVMDLLLDELGKMGTYHVSTTAAGQAMRDVLIRSLRWSMDSSSCQRQFCLVRENLLAAICALGDRDLLMFYCGELYDKNQQQDTGLYHWQFAFDLLVPEKFVRVVHGRFAYAEGVGNYQMQHLRPFDYAMLMGLDLTDVVATIGDRHYLSNYSDAFDPVGQVSVVDALILAGVWQKCVAKLYRIQKGLYDRQRAMPQFCVSEQLAQLQACLLPLTGSKMLLLSGKRSLVTSVLQTFANDLLRGFDHQPEALCLLADLPWQGEYGLSTHLGQEENQQLNGLQCFFRDDAWPVNFNREDIFCGLLKVDHPLLGDFLAGADVNERKHWYINHGPHRAWQVYEAELMQCLLSDRETSAGDAWLASPWLWQPGEHWLCLQAALQEDFAVILQQQDAKSAPPFRYELYHALQGKGCVEEKMLEVSPALMQPAFLAKAIARAAKDGIWQRSLCRLAEYIPHFYLQLRPLLDSFMSPGLSCLMHPRFYLNTGVSLSHLERKAQLKMCWRMAMMDEKQIDAYSVPKSYSSLTQDWLLALVNSNSHPLLSWRISDTQRYRYRGIGFIDVLNDDIIGDDGVIAQIEQVIRGNLLRENHCLTLRKIGRVLGVETPVESLQRLNLQSIEQKKAFLHLLLDHYYGEDSLVSCLNALVPDHQYLQLLLDRGFAKGMLKVFEAEAWQKLENRQRGYLLRLLKTCDCTEGLAGDVLKLYTTFSSFDELYFRELIMAFQEERFAPKAIADGFENMLKNNQLAAKELLNSGLVPLSRWASRYYVDKVRDPTLRKHLARRCLCHNVIIPMLVVSAVMLAVYVVASWTGLLGFLAINFWGFSLNITHMIYLVFIVSFPAILFRRFRDIVDVVFGLPEVPKKSVKHLEAGFVDEVHCVTGEDEKPVLDYGNSAKMSCN